MDTVRGAKWMIAACICAALLAGCSSDLKPTNAKLEKGLNDYLADHSECLYPRGMSFPYEVSPGPGSKAEEKRMDAMKAAGLLNELKDLDMHVERYTLTTLGQRVAPRFCYGHKEVTSVDSFTPPVKQGNVLQTTVTFHADMHDVPIWARTKEMTDAFPDMGANLSGPQPSQIVMATAGVGWQVR